MHDTFMYKQHFKKQGKSNFKNAQKIGDKAVKLTLTLRGHINKQSQSAEMPALFHNKSLKWLEIGRVLNMRKNTNTYAYMHLHI